MQEIPENAADTAHLAFLHGPAILSGSDLRYTKSRLWDFMKHVWKVAPRLPTWPHDVQSPPGQVAFLPLFPIPATFPPFRSHLFCISEPSKLHLLLVLCPSQPLRSLSHCYLSCRPSGSQSRSPTGTAPTCSSSTLPPSLGGVSPCWTCRCQPGRYVLCPIELSV